jgi:two-component system CheB/CheR fusion protein
MPKAQSMKGTVLHVEDDAAVAASIGLLLRVAGFRTLHAPDGESALRLVRDGEFRPDVLVLDYNLPGDMDGTETAEALCRALREPLPTILLSGELPNAAMPWLPGVPIWPMAKPTRPELLVRAVEAFVDLHHWTESQRELEQPTPGLLNLARGDPGSGPRRVPRS